MGKEERERNKEAKKVLVVRENYENRYPFFILRVHFCLFVS